MNQMLINLAVALAINELIHNVLEIVNIQAKVVRLKTYIAKKPFKEIPVNIDTRAKSYGISIGAFVILVAILYGVVSLFNPDAETALMTIIGLLVVSYFISAVMIDRYHVSIEKVTRPFMK